MEEGPVMSIIWESGATTVIVPVTEWQEKKAYRIHILLTQEDDGSFSAVALNLPGAGSCGDTEEEAIENAKEAILGVLEVYESSGLAIPWQDDSSAALPPGAKHKWIMLDA